MKANLNRAVTIRDKDKGRYHTLNTRIKVPPEDAKHPLRITWLKCWRDVDYNKYFNCSEERKIGYLQAMNIDECELVHDPTIDSTLPVLRPGPVTVKKISKPKKGGKK